MTEPARTSPTANSPATDVAKVPRVVTNPLGSSSTPASRSHAVRGTAPIIRNSPPASSRTSCCRRSSRHVSSERRFSPRADVRCDRGWTVIRSWWSEPLREIARHGLGEVVAPDEDVHVVDLLREEQRGLPGRVGASHHDHVLTEAGSRFELGRGVVDAAALELGDTRDLQPAVLHAAGDDHGPGGDVVVVVEPDLEPVRVARQSGHRPRRDEPRPELDRLQHRRPGQLAAGDPAREAEVVLDPRRRAGLPSQRDVLDDDDIESLGGPVDGGGQAGRPGADDQEIATRLAGQPERSRPTAAARSRVVGRVRTASSSGDHGRSRLRERARRGDLAPRGRVRAQHRPIGHVIALGELLQPVHVTVVVAGEDQAALSQTGQQTPPGVEGGEQHVAQLRRGRDEPAQVRDAHAQERGVGHRDAGEEGRLSHQHAELADEVAGLDHEPDPVASPVDETDSAREDEVEVVGVARIPQHLAGLGPDHVADRLQQPPALLVELRPRLDLDLIRRVETSSGSARRASGWRRAWASRENPAVAGHLTQRAREDSNL